MMLLNENALAFGTLGIWAIILLLLSMYSTIRAFSLRRSMLDMACACVRVIAAFLINQGLAVVAMRRAGADLAEWDLIAEKWINLISVQGIVAVFLRWQ